MKDIIWDESGLALNIERIAGVRLCDGDVYVVFDTGFTQEWQGSARSLFELLSYPIDDLGEHDQ